jgi:hypothetical protein
MRFRRISARGERFNALEYYLSLTEEKMLPLPSKPAVLKYFSKNAKEREEVRARLAQYDITPAELHAKAAQLNSEPIQMFERMITARANGRRMLRKEARRNAKRDKNNERVRKSTNG